MTQTAAIARGFRKCLSLTLASLTLRVGVYTNPKRKRGPSQTETLPSGRYRGGGTGNCGGGRRQSRPEKPSYLCRGPAALAPPPPVKDVITTPAQIEKQQTPNTMKAF